MSLDIYDAQGKPESWAFERGLLSPRATEWWTNCNLAFPLWNFGGGRLADLSGNSFDGIPGAAAGGIAVLNHDGGDFSEYDDTTQIGSGGFKVTVDAVAGLNSTSHGVKLDMDGVTAGTVYAVKDISQWTTQVMRIRCFVDPNTVSVADSNRHVNIVTTYYNTSLRDAIRLRWDGTTFQLGARMVLDDFSEYNVYYDITDAPHRVEVRWRRATGSSTNDGDVTIWIDGSLQGGGPTGTVDRFDMGNEANKIRVGASGGREDLFNGSVYIDGLIARDDDMEIGLADFVTGTLDWDADAEGPIILSTASNDKVFVTDQPGDLLDGGTKLSIECRFRADTVPTAGNQAGLVGKWQETTGERSWRLYLEGDELRLAISADGTTSGTYTTDAANIQASTWYSVVVTYDAGTVKFYIDSVEFANTAASSKTSFKAVAAKMLIGARMDSAGAATDELVGAISSIRIWKGRILNKTEVVQLFEHPWEMYHPRFLMPSFGLVPPVSGPAGPWELALTVAAGSQAGVVTNLVNGVSYDIQLKTVDQSGNESTGSTILSKTPAAVAARPPHTRFPLVTDVFPSPERTFAL